jgi:AraC family transcriptional regulator, regulatory protein of adaptative response / methylated-DNA-[protein]-cysteine methyltransferase
MTGRRLGEKKMPALLTKTNRIKAAFSSDDERWQAVVNRNAAADGAFFYSVRTTGVYCRPTCPSRLARRKNVRFHATCQEAERAGFRPCKRCQPSERSLSQRHAEAVARACRSIEQCDEFASIDDLAKSAGMSPFHFHRVFKAHTGVTPKAYASAHRAMRVREELLQRDTVTEAIYGAGFNSNSRFYASVAGTLGMTPTVFREGGFGVVMRFAVGECWLGSILVAASDIGVCAIFLGDDADELVHCLQDRFPKAQLIGGDQQFERLVAAIIGFVETPAASLGLPLDIRGTAFQQRVWQALREIPPGSTATYADIARKIGQPTATRAVAQACGANPLAVAIPCHRVVRTDGSLSGYRWGVERKSKLLRRERAAE